MSRNKSKLGIKLKKILTPSVGKLLGIMMVAYFLFTFISYKDRVQVNYYEVEEGSLVKEHNYTGLILRSEQIVDAEASGFIYYYVADGRKAANGSRVYSIDETGDLMNYLGTHSSEIEQLNSDKIADIRAEVLSYSREFSDNSFYSLYNIRNTLEAHAIEYASMNIFSSLEEEFEAAGIRYGEYTAPATGVVCCYTDGYESYTEADLAKSLFDETNYNKETLGAGHHVDAGTPAYKLITDENWQIAFQMSDEDLEEFGTAENLRINFSDKGFSTTAKFHITTGSDGRRFGVLSLDSYLVQFTSDRFVDFEVVTNDVSGLKIPEKSITTLDFYVIPVGYLQTDDKGNKGFYKAVVSESGTSSQFVIPDIYNVDDQYCYIECGDETPLKVGDFVMASESDTADYNNIEATAASANTETASESTLESNASDSSDDNDNSEASSDTSESGEESTDSADTSESSGESAASTEKSASGSNGGTAASGTSGSGDTDTAGLSLASSGRYQIGAKRSLEGAYNVNKGYTMFKKVEILETSNGYSIVKKNSSYGLSVYDHIVLDASTVHNGQLLYR